MADNPETPLAVDGDASGVGATEPNLESRSTPEVLQYAGFWRRLGAFLIDGLILTSVEYALAFGIGGADALGAVIAAGFTDPATWLAILFQWAYFFVFTWFYGATVGKMMLGLKVIRVVAGEGGSAAHESADWLTVLFREVIGKTLSSVGLGLGYLWAAFHPKKQGWHDLIADTVVVRSRVQSA